MMTGTNSNIKQETQEFNLNDYKADLVAICFYIIFHCYTEKKIFLPGTM